MHQISVSVIVPVYNTGKYLENCITSIINQTFKNIELILVDDGSKDNSGTICDEWRQKDTRISVIHKKNGGLVSARKEGLKQSNNDWIVFVDSDDWIEPGHINMMVDEYYRTGADIVVSSMKQVYYNHSEYIPFIIETKNYSGKDLYENLYPRILNTGGFEKRGVPVSRCSKLINKQLLIDNLKYSSENVTYEEDLNIMFPVIMDAKSISLIKVQNAAYCYRMVEDSMLHGYDRNMLNSINNVFPAIIQACKDKNKTILLSQVYIEYLTAMVRNTTNELQNPAGLSKARENIKKTTYGKLLRKTIVQTDWTRFPVKFKIVVIILNNYNWFNRNILLGLLFCAKKISLRNQK